MAEAGAVEIRSFIGDGYVSDPRGASLPVVNPATEGVIATVREAGSGEVDHAVRVARQTFETGPWRRTSVEKRQAVLDRVHALVIEHADELARLECSNTGLPLAQIKGLMLPRAAQNFRFFAEYIGQAADRAYRQEEGFLTLVTREPKGVAALISPWNAPIALSTMKLAGCIAFGNSCIIKPSEQTPSPIARLVELMLEAGVPPGVVNMVNGSGDVTGRALVEHPDVDAVSFTGGTETGRRIMASAACGPKALAMELGGKSANVVFEDADFERALDGSLLAIFGANGEACLAGSRILLAERIAERFMEAFVARTRNIRIGDPTDMATEMGPISSRRHMERVLSYADIARVEQGRVLYGGGRAGGFARGFYIDPIVVLARDNESRVCQEEIFGPFATFVTFRDEAEAYAIANRSRFGLASYVWTRDLNRALRASREIRAGTVWVNTSLLRDLRSSFGGTKDSGFGREGGLGCESFYTEEKSTIIALGDTPIRRLGMNAA